MIVEFPLKRHYRFVWSRNRYAYGWNVETVFRIGKLRLITFITL